MTTVFFKDPALYTDRNPQGFIPIDYPMGSWGMPLSPNSFTPYTTERRAGGYWGFFTIDTYRVYSAKNLQSVVLLQGQLSFYNSSSVSTDIATYWVSNNNDLSNIILQGAGPPISCVLNSAAAEDYKSDAIKYASNPYRRVDYDTLGRPAYGNTTSVIRPVISWYQIAATGFTYVNDSMNFSNNPNLSTLTIPASVTSIGHNSFNNCPQLTNLTFNGNNFVASVFIGDISGNTLTVTTMNAGAITTGMSIHGSGVAIGTAVASFGTGRGGVGTYNLSVTPDRTSKLFSCSSMTVTGSILGQTLTVTHMNTIGTITVGLTVTDIYGDLPTTVVTATHGSSGVGTYTLGYSQNVTSRTLTSSTLSSNAFTGSDNISGVIYNNLNCRLTDGITQYTGSPTTFDPDYYTIQTIMSAVHAHGGMTPIITTLGNGTTPIATNFTSIYIAPNITVIRANAFKGCQFNNVFFSTSAVTIDPAAFDGCTVGSVCQPNYAPNLTLPPYLNAPTTIYFIDQNRAVIAYTGNSNGKDLVIPEHITGIGPHAFERSSSFYDSPNSIVFPSTMTFIASYAFKGCTHLQSVTIPASVTSIDSTAFEGCINLKTITMLGITISNGLLSSSTVSGAVDLTVICSTYNTTGNGYTISLGSTAFTNNIAMTSIVIPANVGSIDIGAFTGCTNLTTITISPNTILSSIDIFNSCTSLSNINGYRFNRARALTGYTGIGSAWDLTRINNILGSQSLTSIAIGAFAGYNGVTLGMDVSGEGIAPNTVIAGVHGSNSYIVGIPQTVNKTFSIGGFQLTGSVAGDMLTVTDISYGTVGIGAYLYDASGNRFSVISRGTGTGNVGTYVVASGGSQTVSSRNLTNGPVEFTGSISGNTMTVTAIGANSGKITVGMPVFGPNVLSGTSVTAFSSGSGGIGTYIVNITPPSSNDLPAGSNVMFVTNSNPYFMRCSITGNTLNVTSLTAGNLQPGTQINSPYQVYVVISGSGGTGSYTLGIPQTVGSAELTNNRITFIGSISGNTLTVSSVSAGTITVGMTVAGAGVLPCIIALLGTGSGGVGTYILGTQSSVSTRTFTGVNSQFVGSIAVTTLTVSSVLVGTLAVNMAIDTNGTVIAALGTGTGGVGTYVLGCTQTVGYGNYKVGPISFYGNISGFTLNIAVITSNRHDISGSIIIPSPIASIGASAFTGCVGITDVTFPSSVTSISASAFQGCLNLTNITITSSSTSIGDSAFLGCPNLTTITIPSSITDISSSAFASCPKLRQINNYGFYQSDSISYLTLTSYLGNVDIGAVFDMTVELPLLYKITRKYLTTFGGSVLGGQSFKTINVPNTVTYIGPNAFSNCGYLETVSIPNSVTTIDNNAFGYCHALKKIIFPPSITSLGANLFFDCSGVAATFLCRYSSSFESNRIFDGSTSAITVFYDGTESAIANTWMAVTSRQLCGYPFSSVTYKDVTTSIVMNAIAGNTSAYSVLAATYPGQAIGLTTAQVTSVKTALGASGANLSAITVVVPSTTNTLLPPDPVGTITTYYAIPSTPGSYTITGRSDTITVNTSGQYFLNGARIVTGSIVTLGGRSGSIIIGSVFFTPSDSSFICFLADAPVLTPTGYRRIASLKVGDLITTASRVAVPIVAIKGQTVEGNDDSNPYVIRKGSMGAIQDLEISPGHKVEVNGEMIEARCLGLERKKIHGKFNYYNLELPNYENMVVAGVTVESLCPVRRVVVSMAKLGQILRARYGEITPAIIAHVEKKVRLLADGRVEIPVFKNRVAT